MEKIQLIPGNKSAKTITFDVMGTNLVLIATCDSIKQMYSDVQMLNIAASPKMFNLGTDQTFEKLFGDGCFLLSLKYKHLHARPTRQLSRWLGNVSAKRIFENVSLETMPEIVFDSFRDNFSNTVEEFWSDLLAMYKHSENWESDIVFDPHPENYAIDANNRLIALDILHSPDRQENIKLSNKQRLLGYAQKPLIVKRWLMEALEEYKSTLHEIETQLNAYQYTNKIGS
jgi:hypothetical protein